MPISGLQWGGHRLNRSKSSHQSIIDRLRRRGSIRKARSLINGQKRIPKPLCLICGHAKIIDKAHRHPGPTATFYRNRLRLQQRLADHINGRGHFLQALHLCKLRYRNQRFLRLGRHAAILFDQHILRCIGRIHRRHIIVNRRRKGRHLIFQRLATISSIEQHAVKQRQGYTCQNTRSDANSPKPQGHIRQLDRQGLNEIARRHGLLGHLRQLHCHIF